MITPTNASKRHILPVPSQFSDDNASLIATTNARLKARPGDDDYTYVASCARRGGLHVFTTDDTVAVMARLSMP